MSNGHSETYSRDDVSELYARNLVEEQAVLYEQMIRDLQDEDEPGQVGLW
ncbi:hypothetical protein [Actinocorallia aurantiaca]|uniref:Uncharacterized protein n=1 Tax=Actinocorallia aurantiaca TaxID=46204 RepID=A0ABN3UJ01_9ACTN